MSSEIRRGSADDPGETGETGAAAGAPGSTARMHLAYAELCRQDLPEYDGDVPPPLEGADPGNEDIGEPAETTGLGEGYHSPAERQTWLDARAAGDGGAAPGGQDSPPGGSGAGEGTNPAGPGGDTPPPPGPPPDDGPDTPSWVTTLLSAVRDLQAQNQELKKLVGEQAAKSDAAESRHQEETGQLKQRISALEAKLEAVQAERQAELDQPSDAREEARPLREPDAAESDERATGTAVDGGADDDADAAGIDRIDGKWAGQSDEDTPPKRPLLAPQDKEALGSVVDALGSAGITIPGASWVLDADSQRRNFEKKSPAGQWRAMELAETYRMLVSSMSPDAAAAAMMTGLVGPALFARSRDIIRDYIHKIRHKD